jgi:hypothetical protein
VDSVRSAEPPTRLGKWGHRSPAPAGKQPGGEILMPLLGGLNEVPGQSCQSQGNRRPTADRIPPPVPGTQPDSGRTAHSIRLPTPAPLARASKGAIISPAGMTKGSCASRCSRVAATSAAPSGAPCDFSLPPLLGEPLAMVVLQQIRVGLRERRGPERWPVDASASWPSTLGMTCQPQD